LVAQVDLREKGKEVEALTLRAEHAEAEAQGAREVAQGLGTQLQNERRVRLEVASELASQKDLSVAVRSLFSRRPAIALATHAGSVPVEAG
jgi:hypothetical protein